MDIDGPTVRLNPCFRDILWDRDLFTYHPKNTIIVVLPAFCQTLAKSTGATWWRNLAHTLSQSISTKACIRGDHICILVIQRMCKPWIFLAQSRSKSLISVYFRHGTWRTLRFPMEAKKTRVDRLIGSAWVIVLKKEALILESRAILELRQGSPPEPQNHD